MPIGHGDTGDGFRGWMHPRAVRRHRQHGGAALLERVGQYASANLIWQLRKRLSVGLEALYGIMEARNGVDSGDHWRVQMGMVYSLFD